jgi:hypothetical protein
MKKIKYFFNTHTLRFEKIEVPLKVRLLQTIGFIKTTKYCIQRELRRFARKDQAIGATDGGIRTKRQ